MVSKLEVNQSVLVASDIFGRSQAFESLQQEIIGTPETAIGVSPYKVSHNSFGTERLAYASFQTSGGIDAYIKKLTGIVQANNKLKHLIGFSAGAAALYRVMSLNPRNDIKLTLFYPGKIRYFLEKSPSCPCHIIFPESESNFSLPDVIKVLKQQPELPELKVEQNAYHHGFMNKDSKAFNATAYNHYCQMLKGLLT
jgi:dienelactone hydrolase